MLFGQDGGKAGVFQVSGYQLFDDERKDPLYQSSIYHFRHLNEKELAMFAPRSFK